MVLCLDKFQAWIRISQMDLQPLEVHVKDESRTVICWIPSYENEPFEVCWEDQGSGFDTVAYIYLDGQPCSGRFLGGKGMTFRKGIRTGPETERPFMFSAAPRSGPSPADAQGLGTIILRIKRIKKTTYRLNNTRSLPDMAAGEASDHRIGFGPEAKCHKKYPTTWNFKPYEPGEGAYVTFIWRYRPAAWLASNGIVKAEYLPKVELRPPPGQSTSVGHRIPSTSSNMSLTDAESRDRPQAQPVSRSRSQPASLAHVASGLPSPSASSPMAGPSSAVEPRGMANPFTQPPLPTSRAGMSTKPPTDRGAAGRSKAGPQRGASSSRADRTSAARSASYSEAAKEKRKNKVRPAFPGESLAHGIRADNASLMVGIRADNASFSSEFAAPQGSGFGA